LQNIPTLKVDHLAGADQDHHRECASQNEGAQRTVVAGASAKGRCDLEKEALPRLSRARPPLFHNAYTLAAAQALLQSVENIFAGVS
jgi:hypothetical protein